MKLSLPYSVSDRVSQFILAQAGQSPVGCDIRAYEAEGDGIWDGCCTLPSCAWGMCEVGFFSPLLNYSRAHRADCILSAIGYGSTPPVFKRFQRI